MIWKGQSHFNSSSSWPTDDVLLSVQVFHRHGDRTPVTLLRSDRDKENSLWASKPSKLYSNLRYDSSSKKLKTINNIPLNSIYQWNHIAARLNGTYIVHKPDNYDSM